MNTPDLDARPRVATPAVVAPIPPTMSRRSLGSALRSRDVLRATAIVCLFLLSLALLWVSREIVLTTFLGVLFGLAVGAATDRLEALRVPRGLGAALVVFTFV
ncbi:MAG: hypothetical protein ABIT38_12610, partial [Gemmatimonadaceae bacterium]